MTWCPAVFWKNRNENLRRNRCSPSSELHGSEHDRQHLESLSRRFVGWWIVDLKLVLVSHDTQSRSSLRRCCSCLISSVQLSFRRVSFPIGGFFRYCHELHSWFRGSTTSQYDVGKRDSITPIWQSQGTYHRTDKQYTQQFHKLPGKNMEY